MSAGLAMTARKTALAVLALAASGPAMAQVIETPGAAAMTCDYTAECYEQEACTFAQFGHDVAIPRDLPGEATLQLGTGDAAGEARVVNDVLVVTARDANASYLLTNADDGGARLSVHIADPMTVVTYHGRCRITD